MIPMNNVVGSGVEKESQYQKITNRGNTDRVRFLDVRKSDNPQSSPLRLHRGFRFSPKLLANPGLCLFPIFELGCPISNSLPTIVKDLFMPFGCLNRFGSS